MLRLKNLASGSGGNATLLHAFERHSHVAPTYVLVDCGLGLRGLNRRLQEAGLLDASALTAIFITHEHSDHAAHALAVALRYRVPLYLSHGTWNALQQSTRQAAIDEPETNPAQVALASGLVHFCSDGDHLSLGALQLQPFTVPHDAREPLQLRVHDGVRHAGILTDLGHAPPYVLTRLQGCHTLILESNHDVDMLARSNYPPFLRTRVGGDFGHLSNLQAAEVLSQLAHDQLRHVLAAHLSAQNNTPDLAVAALAQGLNCTASEILVADASQGSAWLDC